MSRRRARSYSSDEEEGGHSRKRRRTTDVVDIEDRLESLITRVGEKSTSSLESNLEGLASVLEADLSNYKQKILKILCSCVVFMPEKMTVYTTLIGLLNARQYNVGGEFVELLVRNLKEALKTNEFDSARLMVRFLSDLVNCHVIVASSLLSMFDSFIEVTLDDNIPQIPTGPVDLVARLMTETMHIDNKTIDTVRSDWYVYAVMSALPWSARELFEKKEVEFERLLHSIESYISKRQKIHLPALQVWSSNEQHPQEEYLDCLWAQLCNMRAQQWMEKQILRPYLAFDSILCEALQHTLPQIIPPSHHEEAAYPLPSVVFRMFDYTDVPEGPVLPGSHAIERYLIEDHVSYIIRSNHLERKDCAAALLSFPVKNKIPINYAIVEVMFGQLFQLPRAPYLEVFYGSLLIELCKLQPGSMPQVLAQATEMLYERITTMNTACTERLVTWFSYHLSNFQFRWSWDDWKECLGMDPLLPKPKFIQEVLQRCMRFSYHQRMVDIVPDTFEPLLPKKPVASYKYENEGAGSLPGTMVAHKLMQVIKSKCSPDEVLIVLRELPDPQMDEDGVDSTFNPLRVEVFVETLLYLGAKSFSHSFAAIAKFHDVFREIGDTEDAQIVILTSMYDVWRSHQQMMVVLVDKMLKTQIVSCSAVANWLFSSQMSRDFTSFYVWEIMHGTIKKMNKQVTKLQKEVEEMKDRLEAAELKDKQGFDVDDEDDIPTEETMERMEDTLESAQSEQKNLFLIIFQRFIIILTDHLAKCEADGHDYNTSWYKWVVERLQQVFLMHHEQVYKYINILESLMFTSDIDLHILEIFQQFCALRS